MVNTVKVSKQRGNNSFQSNIRNAVYDSFHFSMLKTTETRSTSEYRTAIIV